jgi:hypothetical protein
MITCRPSSPKTYLTNFIYKKNKKIKKPASLHHNFLNNINNLIKKRNVFDTVYNNLFVLNFLFGEEKRREEKRRGWCVFGCK